MSDRNSVRTLDPYSEDGLLPRERQGTEQWRMPILAPTNPSLANSRTNKAASSEALSQTRSPHSPLSNPWDVSFGTGASRDISYPLLPQHEPRRRSASPNVKRPDVPKNRGPGSTYSLHQHRTASTSNYGETTSHRGDDSEGSPGSPVSMSGIYSKRRNRHRRSSSKKKKRVVVREPPRNFQPQHYVAQSAYTQQNPFRLQNFEEFASYPIYTFPPGFYTYNDCAMYGLHDSRATQGDYLLQRLADATNPRTEAERADTASFLINVADKLQTGEWFLRWSRRTNRVHQRYFWVNLQRGTLMWSLTPDKIDLLNHELKLLNVIKVSPECLQDSKTNRTFFRMVIETPDRTVCIATEVRAKFDMWYKALQQMTLPNLMTGLPGIWGRPSHSVNYKEGGAVSWWASRYSPLQAIVDGAYKDAIRTTVPQRVLSSE